MHKTHDIDSVSSIYDEYFQYTREYQEKYGKNTIVLMQVGAFFEIYGLKDPLTNEIEGSHIQMLSDICQLHISEKKTTFTSGTKGKQILLMAGFRDYTIDKYLSKLTDSGYTVPVFVQEKKSKSIVRVLDRVYSAGTYISCDTDSSPKITNNIMNFNNYKYLIR
jgi:DNA mismatch repair protein MutS